MGITEKTTAGIESFQQTTRHGSGCGCFLTGCGIIFALLLVMCIGSYYLTMHTSLPLTLIERALEADGTVRVEGLKGSIASGFEIEKLEFESDEGLPWNELRGIKFKFNGFFDLTRHSRLIIEEVSIAGATIYAEFDESGNVDLGPIDGEEIAEEFAEEWEDIKRDIQDEDLSDLKELRIDLVSAKDIKIINPETDTTLRFDKFRFSDFQMLKGQITRLGELEVISDQLDVTSKPSELFADEPPPALNLTGTLKPPMHKSLIAPLPFSLDIAFPEPRKMRSHIEFLDGQVRISEPMGAPRVYQFDGFSPGEYFALASELAPRDWHVEVRVDPVEPDPEFESEPEAEAEGDKKSTGKRRITNRRVNKISIQPGGWFMLGETRFELQPTEIRHGPGEFEMQPQFAMAYGQLDGHEIEARFKVLPGPPFFRLTLASPTDQPRDLWARLYYEKLYDQLPESEQAQIDAAIQAAESDEVQVNEQEIEVVDF